MHTARQLDVSMFEVRHHDEVSSREDLLPRWNALDRLGVILDEPFGAVGASHLIQLCITAFYDARPSRRSGRVDGLDPRAIYPEIYLFHVDEAHGDHSSFDFWPARKEVVVESEARIVLDAINDRAITRLAVPDRKPVEVEHEHKEPAAAQDRIVTALAYSATGRVANADWTIGGLDRRTEMNPTNVLDPDSHAARAVADGELTSDPFLIERSWPARTVARRAEGRTGLATARRRRAELRGDGVCATEAYRSLGIADALSMLV